MARGNSIGKSTGDGISEKGKGRLCLNNSQNQIGNYCRLSMIFYHQGVDFVLREFPAREEKNIL